MSWFSKLFEKKSASHPYGLSVHRIVNSYDGYDFSQALKSAFEKQNFVSDYDSYQLYDASTNLATAVTHIYKGVQKLRPILYDKRMDQYLKHTDQSIINFLLDGVYGPSGYSNMMAEAAMSYALTGNVYFDIMGNVNREPAAIRCLKPFDISIDLDNDDIAKLYRASNGYGGQMTYNRKSKTDFRYYAGTMNELIHIMDVTGTHRGRGANPVNSIVKNCLSSISAVDHNNALLNNGARPSGALMADKDENLTDKQFSYMKSELENQYTGSSKAGRPMLLEGGLKWVEMSISPKDLDFKELLQSNAKEIIARYMLSLSSITMDGATFNNMAVSRVNDFDKAIEPIATAIFDGLDDALLPRFGLDTDRYKITYNPESAPALIERDIQKGERMANTGVFTYNEIRTQFGKEPLADGGDNVYAPQGLQVIGQDAYTGDQTERSDDD